VLTIGAAVGCGPEFGRGEPADGRTPPAPDQGFVGTVESGLGCGEAELDEGPLTGVAVPADGSTPPASDPGGVSGAAADSPSGFGESLGNPTLGLFTGVGLGTVAPELAGDTGVTGAGGVTVVGVCPCGEIVAGAAGVTDGIRVDDVGADPGLTGAWPSPSPLGEAVAKELAVGVFELGKGAIVPVLLGEGGRGPVVVHVSVTQTVVVELHEVKVVVQLDDCTRSGNAPATTAFRSPAILFKPSPTIDLAPATMELALATSAAAIRWASSIAADTMA